MKRRFREKMFCAGVLTAVLCLCGCQSLGKKFIRKRAPEKPVPGQNMVLEPVDYGQSDRLKRYEQCLAFWKYWHFEFIEALSETNKKRQLDALDEALKNLEEIRRLIDQSAGDRLAARTEELKRLRNSVSSDVYSSSSQQHAQEAEKIRGLILSELKTATVQP